MLITILISIFTISLAVEILLIRSILRTEKRAVVIKCPNGSDYKYGDKLNVEENNTIKKYLVLDVCGNELTAIEVKK